MANKRAQNGEGSQATSGDKPLRDTLPASENAFLFGRRRQPGFETVAGRRALRAASSSETAPLSYHSELKRKALHLLALVVPLGMGWLGMPEALYALVPLTLLGLGGDVLRAASPRFNRFIRRLFGPLMRAHELPPPGHGLVINGATWVLIAATLLTLIFPLYIAVAAFTMFMLSDAVAALVGRRWGRWHWPGSPRTVEGSAAFLLTGLGVVACFPAIALGVGAAGAAAACTAEALPGPGNDNLRVPMAGAVVMTLLGAWMLGEPIMLLQGLVVL